MIDSDSVKDHLQRMEKRMYFLKMSTLLKEDHLVI